MTDTQSTPKDAVKQAFIAKTDLADALVLVRATVGRAIAPKTVEAVDELTADIMAVVSKAHLIVRNLTKKK